MIGGEPMVLVSALLRSLGWDTSGRLVPVFSVRRGGNDWRGCAGCADHEAWGRRTSALKATAAYLLIGLTVEHLIRKK